MNDPVVEIWKIYSIFILESNFFRGQDQTIILFVVIVSLILHLAKQHI